MGNNLSNCSSSSYQRISDVTREKVMELFYVLRANPKVSIHKIEGLLSIIPKNENILCVTDSTGYNILQTTVALNHVEIVKWILSRSTVDINRSSPCSLPLHIACLKGYKELVDLMVNKYKARTDLEHRMCWPGPHHVNCEARSGNCIALDNLNERFSITNPRRRLDRSSEKLQNAVCYAIDGDHPEILDLLLNSSKRSPNETMTMISNYYNPVETSSYFLNLMVNPVLGMVLRNHGNSDNNSCGAGSNKKPLLHGACERSAWACVQYLIQTYNSSYITPSVATSSKELLNQLYDEYYPIHHAVLCHDIKFVQLLLSAGASATVRTATENMTVLHVLYYRKGCSAEDALTMTKLLIDSGMREFLNEPDSLGNTILHTVIVRYALEDKKSYSSRLTSTYSYTPWSKWDTLNIIRFIISQGARASINHPGNSALACVLRHVRDWEFRYELLSMLLQEGGDPNVVGRDGSVPLMVCLVPMINKDLLGNFTHTMKVFYLNCIRILLKHGAEVNCSSRTHLTPLHVLMFAASEYMGLMQSDEKKVSFDFLHRLLELMLSWGLDPNNNSGKNNNRSHNILLQLIELVNLVRNPSDLDYVYDLSLTLIQYGANVDVDISMDNINSPTGDNFVHSQSGFYLKSNSMRQACNKLPYHYTTFLCKKEHLLLDPQKRFARLFRLYANSMNYKESQQTLRLIYTQSAIVPIRTGLCGVLKEIFSNPRSLQEQARCVVIKKLLGGAPGRNCSGVNLPPALVRYVVGLE